jgi:Chaperone of endosialidase
MKTSIPPVLIAFVLLCFALLPVVQAVVPPPDGGYPGGNTAEGQNALFSRTTGGFNTGVGWFSLKSLTTGSFNTGVGAGTLVLNTADQNTAFGAAALLFNTTGIENTATGVNALVHNDSGAQNTANGFEALDSNTTGSANTANGFGALLSNTTSGFNTAIGWGALEDNITGSNNTAVGANAGIAVTTASNVICIGSQGADINNTAWIGSVYGVQTQSGTTAPVIVSDTGQLGTVVSSERFKKDIATMQKASESILSLRPVTFHYKTDTTGIPQFGLIAEEVAKVNPALVIRDPQGRPYTVRYEAVNAMLLNEFLKEHRKNEEQQKQINVLTAQLKEQAAQIQKVSAQLEANKPAPQVVNNP